MIGILLLILTNFMSGYAIYRLFFMNANTIESILFPQVLSLIATPSLFTILYFLFGFYSAIFLMPLLVLCLFLLSFRIKQRILKARLSWKSIGFFVAMASVMAGVMIVQFFFNLPNVQDTTNYIAIANNIKDFKILPPANPCLFGTIMNYQWFYHLFLALISIYSGISVFWIVPAFTVYLIVLLLSFGFYVALRQFGKEILAASFITIIAIVFFLYYWAPQPQGFSLILILMFLYLLAEFMRTKNERLLILAGLVGAGVMYIHGLSFIFILISVLSFSLYRLIFNFGKGVLREIVLLLAPFVLSIPYYFLIAQYVSLGFLLEPLAGLFFNYLINFNFLLVILPIAIYQIFKRHDSSQVFFLVLLVALFIFVNIFVMMRSNAIDRFVTYMIFPILYISFNFLKGRRMIVSCAFLAVVIGFFIYSTITRSNFSYGQFFTSWRSIRYPHG